MAATTPWGFPGMPPAMPSGGPGVPTRRRRAWIVVLVAVLGAIVAIGIAGTVLFVDRTLPPYDGAHDFLADVVDFDLVVAADRLCDRDRDDPETALALVTRRLAGGENLSVNPLGVDRRGTRATVEYTVSARDGTADRTFELAVLEERGEWRACPSLSS